MVLTVTYAKKALKSGQQKKRRVIVYKCLKKVEELKQAFMFSYLHFLIGTIIPSLLNVQHYIKKQKKQIFLLNSIETCYINHL